MAGSNAKSQTIAYLDSRHTAMHAAPSVASIHDLHFWSVAGDERVVPAFAFFNMKAFDDFGARIPLVAE